MTQPFENRLVAILCADLVGYSRLTERDELGTHKNLIAYLDHFAQVIEDFGGTVANYAGDSVLAYFSTATNAVACAVSVQQAISQRNRYLSSDTSLEFRIGINLGDVFFDDHAFRRGPYGNSINVAVRLEALANPGGICVADAIRLAVGTKLPIDYEFIGEQSIKNIDERVRAYRIRPRPEAVMEPAAPPLKSRFKATLPSGPQPHRVSISKMPITGGLLLGREAELAELDATWQDPETSIVSLVAWGGVGKSTLVNHWLRRMAADRYRGAERVYAWSFYHQGTVDRVTAADEFIVSTLIWFGDPKPGRGSAREKGERLARLIQRQRTLLVLDGLEPLQLPPGPDEGRLVDDGLHTLLCELAVGHPGLCIITTRLPISDLQGFHRSQRVIKVNPLSPEAGASLLRALDIRGSDEELLQASEEFGGHCLALTLLANYLNDAFNGDISRRHQVEALQEDTRQGGHAKRVLSSYASWISNPAEVEILRLTGLFDRPAHPDALQALRNEPMANLTEQISGLDDAEFNRAVSRLRRASLIAERDATSPDTLDAHPLVRQFFRDQLRHLFPEAWRQGNACLFRHFKEWSAECPSDLQEMEPVFQAVIFGCRAGLEQQALHHIYLPRVMRGTEFYAANVLGLRGTLLSMLTHFFKGNWSHPVEPGPDREGLTPTDQLLLLQHVRRLLTTSFGFDPPGIVQCAQKIKSLCRRLGDTGALYSALASDWMRALVNAPLSKVVGLAQEMLNLGNEQDDAKITCGAYSCLANSVFFTGAFARAKEYAKVGIALSEHRTGAEFRTPAITCRCFEALSLWHLGNPGLALERIDQAIVQASLLPSAHSLAVALHFDGYISHFCGLPDRAAATGTRLMNLSRTNGFRFWLAGSYVQLGWARTMLGECDEGPRLLDAGIREWRAAGAQLIVPYWLAMAGEAYKALGRNVEWLAFIEEGLECADSRGETWWKADLIRLKGVWLRERGNCDEAYRCLRAALDLAHAQGSTSLALRAAIELARLPGEHSKVAAARQLVHQTYQSVSSEVETNDLKSARLLLAEGA